MQPPPLLLRLRLGVASPVKPHSLLLPNSSSLPRCRCRCRCRRSWFSNAEPGGPARSRSRRWWSDVDDQLEDDEFDDDGGGGFGGAAGELLDESWFSKVFKAYGYVLPVILASMLVATGPQAFLMAMAIPLAQSAIAFALRTLSTAFRSRDQQDYYYYSDYADDFESSASSDDSSSWSPEPADQSKPPAGDASNSSSSNTKTQSTGFGGWDELDGDDHRSRWSSSSSNSNADAASASPSASASASAVRRRRRGMRPTSSASRMGNSRYKQAPLMMRLLVAVFPFLGSWFRML